MKPERLREAVIGAVEEAKGLDVEVLDVRGVTDITDTMIVASGSSDRHVKAIANKVLDSLRVLGERPIGVEGESQADWVLIDYGDVVLHEGCIQFCLCRGIGINL